MRAEGATKDFSRAGADSAGCGGRAGGRGWQGRLRGSRGGTELERLGP